MSFKKMGLKFKIILGSCVTLALMVVVGWISIDSTNKLNKTSMWVEHTQKVIGTANEIVASAVDMETGMRGYLLAGKEEFLDPYTSGRKKFTDLIASLSKTVDDNPAQVELLGEAEQTIADWLEKVTEPAIELRREIGDAKSMNDMADVIKQAKGKKYFDKFREQIATFIGREEKLMVQRREKLKKAETDTAANRELIAQTTKWVEHTNNVIQAANDIVAAAVNMETGARGYFLAGQEEFLAPYTNGKKIFADLVTSLSTTVNDNPAQVKLLKEISANITDWETNMIEPTIALRREIGNAKTMDDMADLIGEARGKVYFDKFREQMAEFTAREQKLMHERQTVAKNRYGTSCLYDKGRNTRGYYSRSHHLLSACRFDNPSVQTNIPGSESFQYGGTRKSGHTIQGRHPGTDQRLSPSRRGESTNGKRRQSAGCKPGRNIFLARRNINHDQNKR